MIKKISILALLSFLIFSCEKSDPALFTFSIPNLSFQVDPTFQPPFTYYIPIREIRTNTMIALAGHGLDTSGVKSIRPNRATLSVVFGEADLDFIDVVSVRICPLGVNTENCGKEIFYRDPVPFKPGMDLSLVPSNIKDVKDLLYNEKINIQVKLERLRGFPTKTFSIRLDMEFGVR